MHKKVTAIPITNPDIEIATYPKNIVGQPSLSAPPAVGQGQAGRLSYHYHLPLLPLLTKEGGH